MNYQKQNQNHQPNQMFNLIALSDNEVVINENGQQINYNTNLDITNLYKDKRITVKIRTTNKDNMDIKPNKFELLPSQTIPIQITIKNIVYTSFKQEKLQILATFSDNSIPENQDIFKISQSVQKLIIPVILRSNINQGFSMISPENQQLISKKLVSSSIQPNQNYYNFNNNNIQLDSKVSFNPIYQSKIGELSQKDAKQNVERPQKLDRFQSLLEENPEQNSLTYQEDKIIANPFMTTTLKPQNLNEGLQQNFTSNINNSQKQSKIQEAQRTLLTENYNPRNLDINQNKNSDNASNILENKNINPQVKSDLKNQDNLVNLQPYEESKTIHMKKSNTNEIQGTKLNFNLLENEDDKANQLMQTNDNSNPINNFNPANNSNNIINNPNSIYSINNNNSNSNNNNNNNDNNSSNLGNSKINNGINGDQQNKFKKNKIFDQNIMYSQIQDGINNKVSMSERILLSNPNLPTSDLNEDQMRMQCDLLLKSITDEEREIQQMELDKQKLDKEIAQCKSQLANLGSDLNIQNNNEIKTGFTISHSIIVGLISLFLGIYFGY